MAPKKSLTIQSWLRFYSALKKKIYIWRLVRKVLKQINIKSFRGIQKKFLHLPASRSWEANFKKYFMMKHQITVNIERAVRLHLDDSKSKNILDLGSGFGYFLLVNKVLGHNGIGLDWHSDEWMELRVYEEIFRVFKLKRINCRIKAQESLPPLLNKFDLITAFAVCFNRFPDETYWGVQDWLFFLSDLHLYMNDGCVLFFELNIEKQTSRYYSDEVKGMFNKLGASICHNRVTFTKPSIELLQSLKI